MIQEKPTNRPVECANFDMVTCYATTQFVNEVQKTTLRVQKKHFFGRQEIFSWSLYPMNYNVVVVVIFRHQAEGIAPISFGLDSTIFCNRSNHRKWSMYTLLFR